MSFVLKLENSQIWQWQCYKLTTTIFNVNPWKGWAAASCKTYRWNKINTVVQDISISSFFHSCVGKVCGKVGCLQSSVISLDESTTVAFTKQTPRSSLQQHGLFNLPESACRNPVGAVRHESSADLRQMFLQRGVAQIWTVINTTY